MLAATIYCPSDIVFLVQDSGYTSTSFAKVKTFLLQVVSRLDIDSGTTRVGLVRYSTRPSVSFHLSRHFTVSSVRLAILGLFYSSNTSRSSSNLANALFYVRRYILTSWRGDRNDVPNVVVIVANRRSSNTSATQVCIINQ